MDEILNMRPWLFITLLVSFSFVVWVYYSFFFRLTVLFVWLGCGTSCIPFPILFLCSHSRGKIYILYTQFPHMQNSHMQNYNISNAILAYVRNLRKVLICKAISIYRSQSLVWLSNASILICTFVMNYIL